MSKYISGIKSPAFSVDTNGILSTSTTISGTNTIPGVSIGLNTSAIATLELTSSSSSGQSYIDFTHINQDYGGRILYDHSLNELALFTNANASAEVYINNLGNMGIGGRSTTYPLEINGHVQAKNGSFRTTGTTGWYNDTYGSGWYMADNTAVRVFADKHIATAGNIYVTNVNPTGVINLLNNHGINFQTNSTANKINFDPATNLLVYDTSAIHNFYINTVLQTSISTLGITIPNGNALYTTNIDSNTQNVAVGYYTIKSTQGVPTFNVYNNSINRAVLFAVNSGGTSGGNDNVTINPLLFVNNAINITNASGVENLIQNLSVASASPLNLYMPNLSIGNFSAFRVGISSSLNNAVELRFLNVGSQSVLNSVSVAFYGNNNMYTITASGIHTFAGTNATYQIPLILKSTLSCTTINTNSNTITAGQINSGNISTTGGIHVSSYLAPNNQGGTYSWNRDTNSGYTCFTNQQGAGSGGYEFLHCDSSFNIMPGKFVMDSIGNAYTTSTFTCNTLHAATAGINNASPQYTLDVVGDIMARGAFLRTTGNTGWYNDTYTGGWYMVDTTAVRVYGDKNIATAGSLFGQNLILTGNLAISTVTATENYIKNMSTTTGSVLNMTMPNLVNGSSSLFRIGANTNGYNCAEIRFLYNSSGNTSNTYGVGFFGYNNLYNLTAAGVHSFTGTNASFSVPINTNDNNIACGNGIVSADKLLTNNLSTQGGPITCGQISATNIYTTGNIGINTTNPGYSLDIIGQLRTQGGFLRTTGSTGWYNETYTSGWYMIDTTAVRVYNDKHIATAGNIYITNVNPTGIINLQNDQPINFQTNSTANKIRYDSVNALLAYDTNGLHKFFINSILQMTINTLGVTIPNGNSLYTSNIDSATGNVAIGYATLKQSAVYPTFTVYNNSTNRNILFAVNTGGTSSGNDNIQMYTPLNTNDNNITCGNGNLTASIINATTNMNTPSIHVNSFVAPNVQGGTYAWNRTGSGGLTCFTNQQGTGTGGYEFLHYDSSFNLLPGRFTMDNSGNATLTGQLNCASLFASNGQGATENLMQNQAVTPGSILNLMMPNLGINNYTLLRNGVSITANNCAEFRFIYAGSGNAANTAGLGFFGSQPMYTYTVAGVHLFTGSSVNFNIPIYTTSNVGIKNSSPGYPLDVNGDIRAQGGFLRTTNNTGWYNETYAGGLYMTDTTAIRAYNDKNISTGGNLYAANATLTGQLSCNTLNITGSTSFSTINTQQIQVTQFLGQTSQGAAFSWNRESGKGKACFTNSQGTGSTGGFEFLHYDSNYNLLPGYLYLAPSGDATLNGKFDCYGSINVRSSINTNNNIITCGSITCFDINTNGYNISCGSGTVSANSILCNGVNTQNNRINCGPITCYDIDTQNNGINCGGLNTNNINCTTINTNGYSTFGGGYAPNLWASAYCNGPGIAGTGGTGSTKLCAIFYESLLFAGGWYVRSDSRIKTDIATITNSAEILNTINPCTYMHIDKKKCDVKKYGLIAQEVEKIIPEAINISSDIIPNVMKLAKKISIRSFELDQDLHIGLIRLYISNEGNSESKLDCSIISKSKYIYTVDADITKDIVFVYGEFVDDLKSIDYNAFISILIAGYKTQATEIKKQDARIKRLEELLLSI